MVWYVEQIPDYFLCTGYLYLLVRIRSTNDQYFSTPFFLFFFTTGISGIVSVVSHIVATRIVYYPQTAFIYTSLWIVNHVGALGSAMGKGIILMHRYLVFSSDDICENRWSRTLCRRLICLQFAFPLITSVPFLFFGFKYYSVEGEVAIETLKEQGLLVMKSINGSIYAVYSVYSIVLVVLTGRALLRLSKLVEGPTRKIILAQHRNMFIIVIACSLSHLVKAVHQFLWALSAHLKMVEFTNVIWPFYVYANGLATYIAPIFLVIFSKRVCRLLVFMRTDCYDSSAVTTTSTHIGVQ